MYLDRIPLDRAEKFVEFVAASPVVIAALNKIIGGLESLPDEKIIRVFQDPYAHHTRSEIDYGRGQILHPLETLGTVIAIGSLPQMVKDCPELSDIFNETTGKAQFQRDLKEVGISLAEAKYFQDFRREEFFPPELDEALTILGIPSLPQYTGNTDEDLRLLRAYTGYNFPLTKAEHDQAEDAARYGGLDCSECF